MISGTGVSTVAGEERIIKSGDVITMNVGIPHNESASTVLNIIEVQFASEKSFGDKRRDYSLNSVVSL